MDTQQKKSGAVDPAVLEKLRQSNPSAELVQLDAAGFTVIAKSPGRGEMDLFRTLVYDEKRRASALERLSRACILHPSGEELNEILRVKPGLMERWGDKLLELGGSNEEVEVKKL